VVKKYREVIMSVNSEAIQKKEFHVVFKGYKPEEVDKFLDILAVEFEKLQARNRELHEGLDKLRYEGNKESGEMKKVIQEALVSAHKIAEDIKQKAEKEAEEIVRNKVSLEEESYKKLMSKKLELEKEIEELTREYEGFKAKIVSLVDDFRGAAAKLGESKFPGISKTDEDDLSEKEVDESPDRSGEEEKELIYSGDYESETPESAEDLIDRKEFGEKDLEKKDSDENAEREVEPGEEDSQKIDFDEPFGRKEEPEDKDGSQKIDFSEPFRGKEEETEEEDHSEKIELEEPGKEKIEQEDETEEEKQQEEYDESEETEESDDYYRPKRMKKKIDIANPDIINDFFKTDQD
jgi:cell division initiation protein